MLVVLMATQTIRLFASGYSIALMATGYQNSGIVPVVVEAIVNLAMSLYLVRRHGAIGVAFGSLIGAVVAIPSLFVFCVSVKEGRPLRWAQIEACLLDGGEVLDKNGSSPQAIVVVGSASLRGTRSAMRRPISTRSEPSTSNCRSPRHRWCAEVSGQK